MLLWLEKIFAYVILSVCGLTATICIYWLFLQPSNVITNIDTPLVVNTEEELNVGDVLKVYRSYCLNTTAYGSRVEQSFSNHVIFSLADTSVLTTMSSIGCRERITVVEIPLILPSGDYNYNVRISYRINPLKTVYYDMPTVKVKIVNPVWDRLQKLEK